MCRTWEWFEEWYIPHNIENWAKGIRVGNCKWSQKREVFSLTKDLQPSDTELPFTLKRRQFQIRPCFALSTNKSQGQILDSVGVHLSAHVFTHEQLYVAFHRVCTVAALAVYVNNCECYTENIIYSEVL